MHRRFVCALFVVTAISAVACGKSVDEVDKTGTSSFACERDELFTDVKPAKPFAYAELNEGPNQEPLAKRGLVCEGARDVAKCRADFEVARGQEGSATILGLGNGFGGREVIIVTDEDGVKVFYSKEEVRAWIGAVDSAGDAVAIAKLSNYSVYCNDSGTGVGSKDGGYLVVAKRTTTFCLPITVKQYLLDVRTDGTIVELETAIEEDEDSCA